MRKGAQVPSFEALYDSARQLGAAELCVELRRHGGRRRLWVVLRRTADGHVVHEVPVESTIEAAAAEVRRLVERDAMERSG